MSLFQLRQNCAHYAPGNGSLQKVRLLTLRFATLACILLIQACATSSALTSARDQFRHGNTDAALQALNEAEVSKRDQLLLHFDKGMVAQAASEYTQSIQAFESAYQLVEELDYVSVADQTAATLSNDWATRYSGEISERLWIHTFQMINFLMLDQPTGAAVEARRAVELFEEHDDVLNSDLFTRSLMALSFEAAGQYDSATVEYRKLAQLRNTDESWQINKSGKQLLLMVATGFIEPKYPGDLVVNIDARISFPYYPEAYDQPPSIDVVAESAKLKVARLHTPLLPIARSALDKRGKAIAARQAIRLAAKYNLAKQIEEKDELAGGIARLFLFIMEQADTRSWETLPAYMSLVRVKVPDDVLSVTVRIDSPADNFALYNAREVQLDLNDKKNQFHLIRTGTNAIAQPLVSP